MKKALNSKKDILKFQIDAFIEIIKGQEEDYAVIEKTIETELGFEYPGISTSEAKEIFEKSRESAIRYGKEEEKIFNEKHPALSKLYFVKELCEEILNKTQNVLEYYTTKAFINGHDDILELDEKTK